MRMRAVHVLTASGTPNCRAFNYPLKVNLRRLREHDIDLTFFSRPDPGILDCQSLLINSKVYSHKLGEQQQEIFDDLSRFREHGTRLLWFDTSDSTFIYQGAVLPHVDRFYKAQLLKDRELYTTRYYGGRIYTDQVHQQHGTLDQHPHPAEPLPADQLDRLRLSWHSGLGEYGWRRFYRLTRISSAALDRLNLPYRYHPRFCTSSTRPIDVCCRLGLGHGRETIVTHRREVIQRMAQRGVSTHRVSPRRYLQEMCRSKVAVSPFGLGEISLRDFEVFLCGALLYKPSMAHMETWPDLFEADQTYVPHDWDLHDFDEQLDRLLADPGRLEQIRNQGQDRYRHYLSEAGQIDFCKRLAAIVEEAG